MITADGGPPHPAARRTAPLIAAVRQAATGRPTYSLLRDLVRRATATGRPPYSG
ncbi:hypothetical protein ACIBHX_21965 [Nonomuraea sp. NPDC050536]|uniref:hypothetical protein n=1 Tax=Nonomuraea sp. NPDC050536 TaxID=3364366 RepID=UPI0037CC6F86